VNGDYDADDDTEEATSANDGEMSAAQIFSEINELNRRSSEQDETDFITMNVLPTIDKQDYQDKQPIGEFKKPLLLNRMSSPVGVSKHINQNSQNGHIRPASDVLSKRSALNSHSNRVHPRPVSYAEDQNSVDKPPISGMFSTVSLSSVNKDLDLVEYRQSPPRVQSMDFKRTISEIENQQKKVVKTHRRTQSYALGQPRTVSCEYLTTGVLLKNVTDFFFQSSQCRNRRLRALHEKEPRHVRHVNTTPHRHTRTQLWWSECSR
jgi:hypothetical protein